MISFIIPTLSEEAVIEKILMNLKQYTGNAQIIVSDGGSHDRTAEIARRYTEDVLVYRGEKRQTIAGGRNAGAAIARGEYFVFLDADTHIPDPDTFFAHIISSFEKNPKLVASNVNIRVHKDMETFGDSIVFPFLNLSYRFMNNILGVGASSGEFQMIRRDAFQKIGGYDERLVAGEDQDCFRRLSKIGRTECQGSLTIFHTGRRAHAIGWPKLLWTWSLDSLWVIFSGRARSRVWTEIR